jgi:lambda family phage portal protein
MTNRLKKAWQALLGRDIKNYAAGGMTRLTADWPTQITSPTAILQYTLTAMRARSRDLAINNDYARRFLAMVGSNIIGPNGIILQCKAKWPDGRLDKWANDKIENAWLDWGKKGNFDVTGTLSMHDADWLGVQSVARDGEIIVRIVEDFDNDWGFAVQFLEADHLDETLNVARLSNGNSIRMGVEFDKWFRPAAYHLLTDHPGDSFWTYNRRNYIRVPAENIIHPFVHERINQPRGVPWMHSAMTRLNNIGAYEEAAIIAARIGASKMGNYEMDDEADPALMKQAAGVDEKDFQGNLISTVEPGTVGFSPRGYKFNPIDWKYPDGEFAPFMKASLRGISSGLLVSYNSLANDLEGVNLSSIRHGVQEERDSWRLQQAWWVGDYKRRLYLRWLGWSMLTGKLSLSFGTLEKYQAVKWQPRIWPYMDPEKDANAKVTALENKLTTWTRALAEDGIDLEEHCAELKAEQELAAKYGIDLSVKGNSADAGIEKLKQKMDSYGVGVRAGVITPQIDDENSFRNEAGLPKISSAIKEAWEKDGNVRRPVTLQNADGSRPAPGGLNPSGEDEDGLYSPAEGDRKKAKLPMNIKLTVNTPPVKNEITVQPAAPAQVTVPVDARSTVTVPERPVTVNAPVNVATPEMKVENYNTVQPAAVTVPVENRIEVQPAAPAQVTVPVENRIEVQPSPAPQVTVNTPEVKNEITVQPAPAPQVTVNTPEVKNEIKIPRPDRKKRKSVMKDAEGRVLRTVEEE